MSEEVIFWRMAAEQADGWECCRHCDHDPDYRHTEPCLVCDLHMEGVQ